MTETDKVPAVQPVFVCPFCGSPTPDQPRCAHCSGPLDPLSRQATQNAMGPWFVRDEHQPFRPGCSYETILTMVARGKITAETILRGPSTSQFWYPAKRVPGVAHKLAGGGVCHSCQQAVTTESECPRCGAVFHADPDRQFLGLMPVRALPGSGLPVHEARQHVEPGAVHAPPNAPIAARATASHSQTSPGRESIVGDRLEAELSTLRRRTGILMGVAAGCAIIALGAIWILVSGIAQGEKPTVSGAPTSPPAASMARGSVPAASSDRHTSEPAPRPESNSTETQTVQPSPAPASEPGKMPESEIRRSDELASLRATRWP